MLFDSAAYFAFLTLVVLVYWRLNWRAQNRYLLAASYFFYGWWDWRFLLLMIFSTVVDFTLAGKIDEAQDPRRRKVLLTMSLVMNFGFLGIFKYCNFFIDSMASLLQLLGAHHVPRGFLQIVLPPGISFYTFQEVAYIVDVYNRKLKPAKSLLDYALFISLFPHLIAGPIQRPSHLLPQVQHPRDFNTQKFFDGVMLICCGLFRKCVIADQCAVLANAAFAGRMGHSFYSMCIGIYAFAWQIYGDFSGYSDMARGSAQLLGFHFMVNFRQPYFSRSLQDFWRRWHISLSTWLRDYLYIDYLGGNRKGAARTYVNLMATMLLGGLWHGANWTFVVWGGIHGAWLALERWLTRDEIRGYVPSVVRHATTLMVVGVAWVFFRAPTIRDAFSLLSGFGHFEWRPEYHIALSFLAVVSATIILIDWRLEQTGEEYPFQNGHVLVPVTTAMVLLAIVAVFGATDSNAFIYFQF
jgi:D-alanyl-lipoteichoic acid acyltransferase DltB (MBOAT superfamily)